MFDKSFEYKLIQRRKVSKDSIVAEHIYSFFSTQRRYIVLVEEYERQVFVPKFFPSTYRNSPHKYNIIVNDFEPARIVRTCINIMLEIRRNNPDASFAFVGANTVSQNKKESKAFTQRFRIYRSVMFNFFDQSKWLHYDDLITSTYLLIPANNSNMPAFAKEVVAMFAEIYPDLENIEI